MTTQNPCGSLTLTPTKPDSLLVPVKRQVAPFDPLSAEVDHLLCYKAKAATKLAKGTQVDVADDFQTRRYDLKKATRLCIPVSINGPLGAATLDTAKEVELCIPSTAALAP